MEAHDIIAKGQRCLDLEIAALQATSANLGTPFSEVVTVVMDTLSAKKKLIFSGIGKNAHICEKLVGTFNSIGAPSCFMDPVRALHGDMGLCQEGDALLAFSNKGETEELLRFVPIAKRFDLSTIAVTSRTESTLAELCEHTLPYIADKEACPLDLAPTASTTASMAIGDALAMVLLELRSLSKEDFARYHPGGSLGRTLSPRVDQVMRGAGRFAIAHSETPCRDCLALMCDPTSGCIALTNSDGNLEGILTDGDIRRLILSSPSFLEQPASMRMTHAPKTILSGSLAVEALQIFEKFSIDDLIVVDSENRPIGVIDGQDLTKARLI